MLRSEAETKPVTLKQQTHNPVSVLTTAGKFPAGSFQPPLIVPDPGRGAMKIRLVEFLLEARESAPFLPLWAPAAEIRKASLLLAVEASPS